MAHIGGQDHHYLSSLGGFVLKVCKVAVISAILEDLCKRIQGRRYLSNLGGFV